MKNKIILAVGLISSSAMAANEPANLSVGMAVDQQLSVVVEVDNKYRGIIGNDGMAFDYIAKRGVFDQNMPITWYVGVGGWYEWDDEFGIRVPLGVNWDLSKGWDVYAQIHPELDLYKGPDLQLGGAVGVKYSF
ncbi:hypothetical protein BBM25_07375 [Vibrio parahaemolyticus]|uniref:hypothetical protein n=1 Tax=Vibrio parahaemolyticus TaxID=670 RepID=UPI00084BBDFB|nr:hypothetical protein [Vibrio parahaemolyticus]EID0695797.1 hypothetical protein [Vibrio parahaemolyticus]ELA9068745.1 hypothetical protein [Vibrio parahaemolyticus]ODY54329.1 hypothetical protein BBM25_07375 [Vibrio parahaemolyticus]HCG6536795.1 hypothetical protein [Vibrio parahaemolyticus]HCH0790530.1 hypothetical protein [Vibrio parahaemolyticus]